MTLIKKITFTLLISFFAIQNLSGQEASGLSINNTISLKQGFWSNKFYSGGQRISKSEAYRFIKTNPTAAKKLKRGRVKKVVANVLAFSGGFVIGYYYSNDKVSDEESFRNVIIGGVIVGTAIGIDYYGSKNIYRAIQIYNQALIDKEKKN